MRKKVEMKIRQAVAELGPSEWYRVDKVRERTDAIRKVFDKTILDMARVDTIELVTGDTGDLAPAEIRNLVTQGETVYVNFRFIDDGVGPEAFKPESVDVELKGIEEELWLRFAYLCRQKEEKEPDQMVKEWIEAYIEKHKPASCT